jgi:hypothetical protein
VEKPKELLLGQHENEGAAEKSRRPQEPDVRILRNEPDRESEHHVPEGKREEGTAPEAEKRRGGGRRLHVWREEVEQKKAQSDGLYEPDCVVANVIGGSVLVKVEVRVEDGPE